MLQALLLDLDDTLLGNPDDLFISNYLRALSEYMAHVVPPDELLDKLLHATQAMDTHQGGERTNEEVFSAHFFPALGIERARLEPLFERFYREEFAEILRPLTQRRPAARQLVEWAFAHELEVAIVTNPFFPRIAVEQRLILAGVPTTAFDYHLVTTYENMHTTKSSPAYYHEILERLERRPEECLMVGNDWQRDVLPAHAVGIPVYWVTEPGQAPPTADVPLVGHGTLAALLEALKAGTIR
jgi:FMN phosphatase YigB (HAD superfamily)